MAIQIETVKTDSFDMKFFRFGKGKKPYVIIPGISIQSVMNSADTIAENYAVMADEYEIYVFDRREDLPASYSIQEMARDTAKAMKTLGLHDVYLFGASQGGMIALVIAIEFPELVKKMVLGSTSAHIAKWQDSALDHWEHLAEEKDGVKLYLEFGKVIYPPDVFHQYKDALISAGEKVTEEEMDRFLILLKGSRNFDVTKELDKIQCPVLAIGVYEDAVLDSDATMEIAEKLDERKDFKLYMYKGYGHAAFDTAPDYRERIMKFFEQ